MRKLPFWVHQAAEYVLAFALIMQATQGGRLAIAVAMGGVLLLVTTTADGPLSGWKAVPRPVHRTADIVVAAVLIGLAVVPGTGVDVVARMMMGLIGVAMVVLVLRTDYSPRVAKGPRQRPDAEAVGRTAGRLVGKGVQAVRRKDGPDGAGPAVG